MKIYQKALVVLAVGLCIGGSVCSCTVTTSNSKTSADSDGNIVTVTTTTKKTGFSDPVTTTTTTYTKTVDGVDNSLIDDSDDDFFTGYTCGEVAEDGNKHKVTVSIENETGKDITALYMGVAGENSWANFLDDGQAIKDGETLDAYLDFTYSEDSMSFDTGIDIDGREKTVQFDTLDISDVSADGFTLTFVRSGNGYAMEINEYNV